MRVARDSQAEVMIPDRPKLRDDLIFREIEEDFVVYDPVTDQTTLLNISAAAVLDLCDGARTLDDITTEIGRLFQSEREAVGQEVERVLQGMASRGLLERANTEN